MAKENLIAPIKRLVRQLNPKLVDVLIGIALCIVMNFGMEFVVVFLSNFIGNGLFSTIGQNENYLIFLSNVAGLLQLAAIAVMISINAIGFIAFILKKRPFISLGILVGIPIFFVVFIVLSLALLVVSCLVMFILWWGLVLIVSFMRGDIPGF